MTELRSRFYHLAWVLSLAACCGSLFFSEVMKLPPCVLCWYQRIAMYPLVLLIPVGILLNDPHLKIYGLTLSVAGFVVASYHMLIYYGVIPESLSPCVEGASCATRQLEWFGFISIPLLSLATFLGISLLFCFYRAADAKGSE